MRILLLVLFVFSKVEAENVAALPDHDQGYPEIERFIRILETVRSSHPNANKLSYERLINYALEGMLDSLDPFSQFYHPETAAFINPNALDYEDPLTLTGLGFSIIKNDADYVLTSIRPNSASEQANLQVGDQLLKIGNETITQLPLNEVLAKLAGPPGERIPLTFKRKIMRDDLQVELLRRVSKEKAIPDYFLLESPVNQGVAYVRLTEFTQTCATDLETALDSLEDQGLQSLILDLRGNPGGLLASAVKLLGLFLPPETLVVTTQGRVTETLSPPLKTPKRQRIKRDYPLIILIDRNSASASELVAGALHDLKRATIIGETSFGKGSVQNIQQQSGGTALRLTYATYHTPSGKTPHLVGVTPDIPVETSEEDRINFEYFKLREDVPEEIKARLKSWRDPYLEKSIEHLTSK